MQAEMTTLLQYTMDAPVRNMMRGGPPPGFFFGGLMTALWVVLLVLLVLWIVRNWPQISAYLWRTGPAVPAAAAPNTVQTPLEIVQIRYAKGEISRVEYETIRRDLSGEAPAGAGA